MTSLAHGIAPLLAALLGPTTSPESFQGGWAQTHASSCCPLCGLYLWPVAEPLRLLLYCMHNSLSFVALRCSWLNHNMLIGNVSTALSGLAANGRLGQRRVSLSDLRLGQNYLTGSLGKLWDNFFWYTFYTEQRGNIWKARVGSFGPQSCFKGTYRRHVNSCSGPAHSHVYRHFCGHWHTHVSRHGYATQACVLWQAYTFLACVDVCTEMWRR